MEARESRAPRGHKAPEEAREARAQGDWADPKAVEATLETSERAVPRDAEAEWDVVDRWVCPESLDVSVTVDRWETSVTSDPGDRRASREYLGWLACLEGRDAPGALDCRAARALMVFRARLARTEPQACRGNAEKPDPWGHVGRSVGSECQETRVSVDPRELQVKQARLGQMEQPASRASRADPATLA